MKKLIAAPIAFAFISLCLSAFAAPVTQAQQSFLVEIGQ